MFKETELVEIQQKMNVSITTAVSRVKRPETSFTFHVTSVMI